MDSSPVPVKFGRMEGSLMKVMWVAGADGVAGADWVTGPDWVTGADWAIFAGGEDKFPDLNNVNNRHEQPKQQQKNRDSKQDKRTGRT